MSVSFVFPPQKKLEREKTEKWAKECVESACNRTVMGRHFLPNYSEMVTNMNLYYNVLDVNDMMKMCDPYGLTPNDFPFKPQHYPVANSKINLLVGEEIKRKFDWSVQVINPDAISEKEKDKKRLIQEAFTDILKNYDPNTVDKRLRELKRFFQFEYQDIRERRATHLLRHIWQKEDLSHKFNMGFLDGLTAGAEVYSFDVIGGEPKVRRCNPSKIQVLKGGDSPNISDADVIVEWGYYSPGKIIDMFHEELDSKEVSDIEDMSKNMASRQYGDVGVVSNTPMLLSGTFSMVETADGKMTPDGTGSFSTLPYVDPTGALLLCRVAWRSYRKVGKLTYYDSKTGTKLSRYVDEFYKADERKGEKIEHWSWVTDWWHGFRIGRTMFKRMEPFPVKAYSIYNPTGTLCPYAGGLYTVEAQPNTSLMGRLKPYAYYYDFMMYKQWETIAKHKGTIGYLDLAMIPAGWEIEDALYYAERLGWLPIDSFKEGNKGRATGTLAGNMNTNRSPMNFDMGNYIQQNMIILQFLKEEMSDISGVSRQREGAINNSEMVGNTERAVMQSSHITEIWFHFHNRIKLEVLRGALECAKFAYKGRKIQIEYITDDISQMLEIDGDEFREIDYGLTVTDAPDYGMYKSTMMNLAQAGLQNDKTNFSLIMDLLFDPSTASIRRKIEDAEIEKQERDQQAAANEQQAKAQLQKEALEAKAMADENKARLDQILEQVRVNGKISIEKMKNLFEQQSKGIPSGDTVLNTETQKELQAEQLSHESSEAEKDRKLEASEGAKDRAAKPKTAK